MPKISIRGEQLPESAIRKLVPYSDKAKALGRKVYHLNIGQPDIKTPQHAIERIRNFDFELIPYGHSFGNESYRNKLAQYYRDRNLDVDSSEILITTGGSEAISFAFMVCFNPGDEIIVPEPFYANYLSFAIATDVVIRPISSSIENGFQLPAIDEFEKVIGPRTKGIFICNPNNPTGYLYTAAEMEALKQIVLKHNLYLFSDEAYREFCYEGHQISAMQLEGLDEHVILMDTISKRYSACGGRIGALVTKNKAVYDAVMKFAQARLSPPSFAQIAGEAAIDLPADYFDTTKSEYKSRRDLLVKRLNAMDQVFCPNPGGAFYAIARLPIDNSDKFSQWLLEDFSFNGQTVMLAPATGFYSTPGLGFNEVRIAYVLKKEDINASMDCLEAALKVYPGRTF